MRAAELNRAVQADPMRHGPATVRLLAEARAAGDPAALVLALRANAWFERCRLSNGPALGLLDEAARVAGRHGLTEALGDVLVARATVRHELGDPAAARRDLDRATPLVDGEQAANLALQLAALHHNAGRLDAAAGHYRAVLENPLAAPVIRAKAANNMADLEARRGRPEEALRWLDSADSADAGRVGPAVATVLALTRAWVAVQLGRLTESLALFESAATVYSSSGLPPGEHLVDYAEALAELRLVPEALAVARQSVAEFTGAGVPLMAAEALVRVAELTSLDGDPHAAGEVSAEAAAMFRRQRRPAWSARADAVTARSRWLAGVAGPDDVARARRAARTLHRFGLASAALDAYLTAGHVARTAGPPAIAVACLGAAVELAGSGPVLSRLRGELAAATLAELTGDPARVLRHCRQGLGLLAAHRAALPSAELRALASGHGAELGRLGLAALLHRGRPAEIFDWLERTRAAALLVAEPAVLPASDGTLVALRAVQAELEAARRGGAPEPADLLARQRSLERRVRERSWQAAGPTAGERPVPLAALRPSLGASALVSYGSCDGALVAVVVTGERTRLVRLGPVAAVTDGLAGLALVLRRLASRPTAALAGVARARLARLRSGLIDPLRIGPDTPVVVVPSGPLHRAPWSLLHPAPVAVAPSASLWARSRRPESSPMVPGRVLLVAGPRLPGAAEEVAALAALHPDALTLTGPDATAGRVGAALADVSLAHLACHGRLRTDNPQFSALELHDGPLTVHELYGRGLAPHRVVLAACESAADTTYRGDELIGFVGALLARGTAGLLASTTLVPDAVSVPVMTALHRRLLGGATMAEALHGTRTDAGTDDPALLPVWCGFTAYGAA